MLFVMLNKVYPISIYLIESNVTSTAPMDILQKKILVLNICENFSLKLATNSKIA